MLFVVISVAAIALRTILTAQVGTTVAATEAALQINGLSDLVKQYMAGARPFTTLQQDYDAYQNTMKSKYSGVLSQKVSIKDAAGGANTTASLEEHVTKIWQEVGQAEALAQQNLLYRSAGSKVVRRSHLAGACLCGNGLPLLDACAADSGSQKTSDRIPHRDPAFGSCLHYGRMGSAMDPVWGTVLHAWIWVKGGAYFGVPASNFLGWYLTAYVIYQLFALYLRWSVPGPKRLSSGYWHLAVVFYAVSATGNLLLAIPQPGPRVISDPAGVQESERHHRRLRPGLDISHGRVCCAGMDEACGSKR